MAAVENMKPVMSIARISRAIMMGTNSPSR